MEVTELLRIFLVFFKIGLFSFGGGYGMLPLIFQSVQAFGFMSAQDFSNLVALSQVTPGPIAVNGATYVGFHYGGLPGALAATLGVSAPSFILVLLVMKIMERYEESRILGGILAGVRPVTVGLIASASILVAETSVLKGPLFSEETLKAGLERISPLPLILFGAALLLAGRFRMSPVKITLLTGLAGAVFCQWM